MQGRVILIGFFYLEIKFPQALIMQEGGKRERGCGRGRERGCVGEGREKGCRRGGERAEPLENAGISLLGEGG